MMLILLVLLESPADAIGHDLKVTDLSFGISDSFGVLGFVSGKLKDPEQFGDFFFTAGSSLFFGGAGVGYQHSFGQGHLAPYATTTALVGYTLPMMCSVEPCRIRFMPMVSGSGGIELRSLREEQTNFRLQIGLWSAFDFSSMSVFESPSDRPLIWPVINLVWSG
tara:strand:+ start:527 stop:1021 length:495 start_codon:yes stop_codon:yes gene_type:complete